MNVRGNSVTAVASDKYFCGLLSPTLADSFVPREPGSFIRALKEEEREEKEEEKKKEKDEPYVTSGLIIHDSPGL